LGGKNSNERNGRCCEKSSEMGRSADMDNQYIRIH
jgi:hypothetical protein